jgi:ABC-type sugar transport system ATPase subunit
MAQPIIEIDRISKSFGALKVLDELSFNVIPGSTICRADSGRRRRPAI